MNKIKILLITITGQLLVTAATLAADSDGLPGDVVYERWCAPCHAPGNAHPGTMALEAKYKGEIPAVLLERTDMTPEFVKLFVRQGVSIMPFFRKTEISDTELEKLAAYLVSKK